MRHKTGVAMAFEQMGQFVDDDVLSGAGHPNRDP